MLRLTERDEGDEFRLTADFKQCREGYHVTLVRLMRACRDEASCWPTLVLRNSSWLRYLVASEAHVQDV